MTRKRTKELGRHTETSVLTGQKASRRDFFAVVRQNAAQLLNGYLKRVVFLQQLVPFLKKFDALPHFRLDILHGARHFFLGGDIVRGGINGNVV